MRPRVVNAAWRPPGPGDVFVTPSGRVGLVLQSGSEGVTYVSTGRGMQLRSMSLNVFCRCRLLRRWQVRPSR